jgi:glycosyltransferase involved in cell wall biosynthesis
MLVSVIMAIYKEKEMHLMAAIESVLGQTYKDIEFIIVNDNPLDEKLDKCIKSIRDMRIAYIRNTENNGLASSLNRAITISKGAYIARMDADDISMPERIERQVAYLEKHRDIDILGTNAAVINERGEIMGNIDNDYSESYIKAATYFGAPLIHPTVMFRRSVFTEHKLYYNESYRYAQDYELWTRAFFAVRVNLLQERLLMWRENENRVSTKNNDSQHEFAKQIHICQIERLGITPDQENIKSNEILFCHTETRTIELIRVFFWILEVISNNDKKNVFPKKDLRRVLTYYYRIVALNSASKIIAMPSWLILKIKSYI